MARDPWFLRLLRLGINATDRTLLRALDRRFHLVHRITRYKLRHRLPLFSDLRERSILEGLQRATRCAIPRSVLEDIFVHIMQCAREYEFATYDQIIQSGRAPDSGPRGRPVVTVVGLGLMGGSLVKACRAQRPHWTLYGVDTHAPTRHMARPYLDDVTDRVDPFLDASDLIVLALPVGRIRDWLRINGNRIARSCVLDVGSVKTTVMTAMRTFLARPERGIGGHPLCGSERSGFQHARADLFIHRTFLLCRPVPVDPEAEHMVLELIRAVGARPVWIDAEQHDRWLTFTSHLPQVLVSAYAAWLHQHLGNRTDLLDRTVGPGLRDMLRLAHSPYSVWRDILKENPHFLRVYNDFARFLEAMARQGSWQEVFEQARAFHLRAFADAHSAPGSSRPPGRA